MNDINKLHAEYSKAKDDYSQHDVNINKKNDDVSDIKARLIEINERIPEIDRLLNDSKKGVGLILSTDELTSLTREHKEEKTELLELNDVLGMQNNALKTLKNNASYRYSLGCARQRITEALAAQAVSEIAVRDPDKLKKFMHLVLSQQDPRLSAAGNYEAFFKQVGEQLCNQVFTAKDSSTVVLPTLIQAMSERDVLVENLV